MITVHGREYRTINDELFVNGKKVYEVYVNGNLVYPESGFGVPYGAAFIINGTFSYAGEDNLDCIGIYLKVGDEFISSGARVAAAFTIESNAYYWYIYASGNFATTPRWLAYVGRSGDVVMDHDDEGNNLNGQSMSKNENYYYCRVRNNIPSEPPHDALNLYSSTFVGGVDTKVFGSAEEAIAYVTS